MDGQFPGKKAHIDENFKIIKTIKIALLIVNDILKKQVFTAFPHNV